MNDLLSWFKLGLAIGNKTPMAIDLTTELSRMQQLCPQAQFLVVGTLVGTYLEDAWEVLETAQNGPKEG